MIDIIVVNGVGGSGKTTFENFFMDIADLMDDSCCKYSMVSRVKEIATYAGWDGGKTGKGLADRTIRHNSTKNDWV